MKKARQNKRLEPSVPIQSEPKRLSRDRPTIAMMVVLPLLQLMLFGYAINTDVRHMPTIVFDQDRTAGAVLTQRALEGSTSAIGAAIGVMQIRGEVADLTNRCPKHLRIVAMARTKGTRRTASRPTHKHTKPFDVFRCDSLRESL